jgi:hypothetical protein
MFSFILTVSEMAFVINYNLTFDDCKILLDYWNATISKDASVACHMTTESNQ